LNDMVTRIGLVVLLAAALPAIAEAQQGSARQPSGTMGGQLSGTTAGAALGTDGTRFGTPGGDVMSPTPGGTIPMGAGTQDSDNPPSTLPVFNNSGAKSGE
jgi:hypothetical protein